MSSEGYVYFAKVRNENLFKIGGTSRDPMNRIWELKCGIPYPIDLYGATELVRDWRYEENRAHEIFESFRVKGEWFEITTEQADAFLSNRFPFVEEDNQFDDFLPHARCTPELRQHVLLLAEALNLTPSYVVRSCVGHVIKKIEAGELKLGCPGLVPV